MEIRKYHSRENISEDIVYIKYAAIEPTDEEFEQYLNDLYIIYDNPEQFVIILDGSDTKFLPARLRIRQGLWLKENEELIKKQCIAQVFVIPNLIVKMILQGIFLVQKPIVDYFVFTKKEEALEKANELIRTKIIVD